MKKLIIVVSMVTLGFISTYGQAGEVKRITLSEGGSVVNLHKLGLVVKIDSRENDFVFYNEDLKKKGNVNLTFESRREFIHNYYYDTLLKKILVFHGKKKIQSITTITPDTRKKKTIEVVSPKGHTLSSSIITIDKSSYILSYKKTKTFLNNIEMANGDITPVEMPEEWKARTILKVQRVNNKYMAILYLDSKIKNKKYKNIALMDDDGKIVEDKLLSNNDDDFPVDEFSITDLGNDDLAIAGTYSQTVKSDYSVGMFVVKIENLKRIYVEYYEYSSMKNFFNYMSTKNKEKAEKKAEKNAKKGKPTKYLAITHQVISNNGAYLVTAEFFYPTYRTESYTTYSNGRATTTYRTVFDGFQYTHTMVLGIDPDGKKEFEHCIPLKLDYKPYSAYQTLRRSVNNDEVKYCYIANNSIYTFAIVDGDLKENDPKVLVEVDDDKKLKSTSTSINSWYDSYFYCLLTQTTKEKGKLIGGKETSYFLIKYDVE